MHDFGVSALRLQNAQDRLASLTLIIPGRPVRISGLIVNDRMTTRRRADRRQTHLLFGDLAAIIFRAARLNDNGTKQAIADITPGAFTAKCCGVGDDEVLALRLRIEGVGRRLARLNQAVLIAPDKARGTADVICQRKAHRGKACRPVCDLIIDRQNAGVCIVLIGL